MATSPDELRAFVDDLGRAAIMSRLRLLAASAITNAIRNGAFPADWFDGLDRLAVEQGKTCPRSFFSFKAAV